MCPVVHIRTHFNISHAPSFESVHELDASMEVNTKIFSGFYCGTVQNFENLVALVRCRLHRVVLVFENFSGPGAVRSEFLTVL